ncbi:MAG: hypothetical protein U0271_04740 [Polyangiaceae bacterium]
MKQLSLVLLLGIGLGLVGCGDDGAGGSGGAGAGGMDMGGSSAGGAGGAGGSPGQGGSGGSGGANNGPPEAPIMQSVEPLEGGLHIMWMNVTTNCDSIELDRNKDGGAYETAYTVAGAATSQHDAAATAPGTYCYKARCVKGAMTSTDSNEKCGTP